MRSQSAYLHHILHCIGRIREDAQPGKEVVFATPVLQDAIVRNLQILCESTQRLDAASKLLHPEVDWRGISGFRNVLVHSYFEIDLETVWTVIENDLPALEQAARNLLDPQPPTQPSGISG